MKSNGIKDKTKFDLKRKIKGKPKRSITPKSKKPIQHPPKVQPSSTRYSAKVLQEADSNRPTRDKERNRSSNYSRKFSPSKNLRRI